MYTICKKFKFEAAHVLTEAYSEECKKIHGHSYVVEFYFRSKKLNKDGMVIDFKKIKEGIQPQIDWYDHSIMVHRDYLHCEELRKIPGAIILTCNPTAENMAEDLYHFARIKFRQCFKVRVYETQTGWVEYQED